jgi:signal recognition particle receptor subunit beta
VVFINYTTMQMTAKIVYYGPGLCGKTTNLQYIHHKTAPKSRGEMISLETETDRTLFFDLLPLDVGVIGGMKVRLQLYTVPGQVFYNATRKLVLKGVDGVVFVADSQVAAFDGNVESFRNLQENLAELNHTVETMPLVLQYNKRDIRNIVPVDKLNEVMNPKGFPAFEAAALHGIGVFETLKAISRLALASVRERVNEETAARKPPLPPASVTMPAPTAAPTPLRPASITPAPMPVAPPVPAPAPAPVPAPAAPVPAPRPVAPPPPPVAAAAPRPVPAAAPSEDLKVEFAEEDPDKHVVRPVSTKPNVDIQDALSKLRMSVMPGKSSGANKAGAADVDQRLKDVIVAVGDSDKQELRKKVAIEVPADLLRRSGAINLHITFDRNGSEEGLPEPVVVKLTNNKKLEKLLLHLDLDIKSKG